MSLLDSALLRRVAGPLRQRAPGVYGALNRVRGRLISRGSLAPYQTLAVERFRETCLRSRSAPADVLEIGSDLRLQVLDTIASFGVRSTTGVNNAEEFWRTRGDAEVTSPRGARLVRGDACHLEFPDASFDAVFSVAAFEHVLDVPAALREIHRVLRPGGRMYAHFGPIWSGCRGHHVIAQADGVDIRHSDPQKNVLPDFAHLLMTPEEMRAAVAARYTEAVADAVVHSVYVTTYLNRLFFHEYEAAIVASPLELIALRPLRDRVDAQVERVLRFKYPKETRFDVTNVEVVVGR